MSNTRSTCGKLTQTALWLYGLFGSTVTSWSTTYAGGKWKITGDNGITVNAATSVMTEDGKTIRDYCKFGDNVVNLGNSKVSGMVAQAKSDKNNPETFKKNSQYLFPAGTQYSMNCEAGLTTITLKKDITITFNKNVARDNLRFDVNGHIVDDSDDKVQYRLKQNEFAVTQDNQQVVSTKSAPGRFKSS